MVELIMDQKIDKYIFHESVCVVQCLQICIYDITLINKHNLNLQTEIIIEGCENVVKLIVIFVCLQKKYTSGVLDFESLKYYD